MAESKAKFDLDEFVAAAEKVYVERWKESLEREHFGELIALAPESGEYVLGKNLKELEAACRERLGSQLVHMFRVGGGGAVKIGGGVRGRFSGRR